MRQNRFAPIGRWCLLLSGILAAACTAPEDQRPDGLLTQDRMASILTEVHLAEGRVGRLGLASIDSSNIVYKRLEGQIYRKFQVDTAVYNKSYVYYSSHPREMEAIYKKVIARLNARMETMMKKPKKS